MHFGAMALRPRDGEGRRREVSVEDIVAIAIVAVLLVGVVAFIAGAVVGYGMRVCEEQDAYRDERIRSALKHWHGRTSHKGCAIFSPDAKEGGIK